MKSTLAEDTGELKERMTAAEAAIIRLQHAIDRISARLDRIETRLGLIDETA
jgi:septal ring factor EnvC (AmiA/AmiB activator)